MSQHHEKPVIRLKREELMKAAIDQGLEKDGQLAQNLGVSTTYLWTVKLPPDHPRYQAPGNKFIAAVLQEFDSPFDRFFFLEKSDTSSQLKEGETCQ